MTARTQALVLLLFGGALLRLAAGQTLLRYVRPVARPWIALAGAAIVALAVWTLVAERRPAGGEPAEVDAHGHRGASRAAWLVIAPVTAVLVIAPPALGAYTADRAPATVAKPADSAFPPLAKGDPVNEQVADFAVRAVWDAGRTLAGRTIRLTGFVAGARPGGFLLARLVITCCAADARPIDVMIAAAGPSPPRDRWVTVTGQYAGVSRSNPNVPILHATSVRTTDPPTDPYE